MHNDNIADIKHVSISFDRVFSAIFPNFDHKDNGFHNIYINYVAKNDRDNPIIMPNGEPDSEWLTFLWWVYTEDYARANDAIHGYLWQFDSTCRPIRPDGSLAQILATDPIVRAERIKVHGYIKHINWIFHKTQNLPHIVIIGSDNIPERHYKLRQSYITVIDPKIDLPGKQLFENRLQRNNYHVVDSYDIFDVQNPQTKRLLDSQNIVIIDGCNISDNEDRLKNEIILAGSLLTEHGRCVFDIPLYGNAAPQSRLLYIVRNFMSRNSLSILNATNLDRISGAIHRTVQSVNRHVSNYSFEIEDTLLTDVGLDSYVGVRVYLKKIID